MTSPRETEAEWLKRNDAYFKAAAILQPYTLHHEAMFMYHPDLLEQVIADALSCRPRGRKLQRVEWAARKLREKMVRDGKTKEVPDGN